MPNEPSSARPVLRHAGAPDARQSVPSSEAVGIPLALGGNLLSARVVEGPSSLRLDGIATGNPAIRVVGVVAVHGLAPQLAIRYRVGTVTHLYDTALGHRTGFTGESIATARKP